MLEYSVIKDLNISKVSGGQLLKTCLSTSLNFSISNALSVAHAVQIPLSSLTLASG
jgi:hypothetical protein